MLIFPLLYCSQPEPSGLSGMTKTCIPEGPDPPFILPFSGQGCCICPFAIKSGQGNTKRDLHGFTGCQTCSFLPSLCNNSPTSLRWSGSPSLANMAITLPRCLGAGSLQCPGGNHSLLSVGPLSCLLGKVCLFGDQDLLNPWSRCFRDGKHTSPSEAQGLMLYQFLRAAITNCLQTG